MRSVMIPGIVLLAVCAGACSRQEPESGAGAPPAEHVWQDQVDTLDKARQVEETLLDAHRQRDSTQ